MSRSRLVPEVDVLIAATLWLWGRGAAPLQVSIAVGSEAGKYEDRRRFGAALEAAGIPGAWTSVSNGPDLIAASATECWQIECKSAGAGPPSTQRDKFDRGLASVVSYFDNLPAHLSSRCPGQQIIGLALPDTDAYLRQLQRISQSLRRALNLWVLLCNSEQRIVPVAPDELMRWSGPLGVRHDSLNNLS